MKRSVLVGIVSLAALSGCGLENFASNVGRSALPRPASVIRGKIGISGLQTVQLAYLDQAGNPHRAMDANDPLAPFAVKVENGAYELRLPSSTYEMIRVQVQVGDIALRTIVPSLREESTVEGVNLDSASSVETLIVEANLSARGKSFNQVTADAYVGNGVDTGTRTLIRKDLAAASSTAYAVLQYANAVLAKGHPEYSSAPGFFLVPVLTPSWNTTSSALDPGWLGRNQVDYTGDGITADTTVFDQALAEAAQLYKPEGCPDPNTIRVIFTADFNQGTTDGNGDVVNRFHWATDKPGKQMFFVGWVHTESAIQDPAANTALGASVPNQVFMYDDGTHGDEVAGDGIWTVSFSLPRGIRVGYKYTWGFRGQVWTGSEEWPGNSRIIEIDDIGPPAVPPATTPGDAFVYRRDVFGDESTNKDHSNLNRNGNGTITWTTDLRGCGIPEAREQPFALHDAQSCGSGWHTPTSIGPVTVACTQ